MSRNHPCLVIAGPTASGKSELALQLAEHFDCEIINYDSVQVYVGFNIASAKIPQSQRRGILHHLIDHVDAENSYSAGGFANDAQDVLNHITSRGKMPLLVGGTGLYLEALLKGGFPGPKSNKELRHRLQDTADRKPGGYLSRILKRLDPDGAEKIHPNDTHKLIRAIEITLQGGEPMTRQWQAKRQPLLGYKTLILGLDPPREQLYERINKRAAQIFASGLIAEVEDLLKKGIPRSAHPFKSLGYAQCLRYLDKACTMEEAIESTALETRHYAKRQLTWFHRRTSDVQWLQGFGDSTDALPWALDTCKEHWTNLS